VEILLTSFVALATLCLLLTAWVVWESQKTNRTFAEKSSRLVETVLLADDARARLLDKAIGLIATKDPLAFQAVQVMNQQGAGYTERYDPSDEAELARYGEAQEGDLDVDDRDRAAREAELEFLHSVGVPIGNV
jgi:hypothetical protein